MSWSCPACGSELHSMLTGTPYAKVFCDDCNHISHLYMHVPAYIKSAWQEPDSQALLPIQSILPEPLTFIPCTGEKVTLIETQTDASYLAQNIHSIFMMPSFSITQNLITVEQFARFTQCAFDEAQGNQPVTDISWFEANRFCAWLSEKTNRLITLPTEPQWQLARQNSSLRVTHQNTVWEWCLTEWASGVDDIQNNSEKERVIRHQGQRKSVLPSIARSDIGFRVCLIDTRQNLNKTSS